MSDKYLTALETLYETTLDPSMGYAEKVDVLLALGQEVFDLPLGILSRIEGDDYTVMHIRGPEGVPDPGTVFNLSETYCAHTLAANSPKSFHHAGRSDIRNHPCYINFQLEAYIGAPIFVDNVRYGTLNFSSPDAKGEPFSDDDHKLINLCAQWIGGEIYRLESRERLQEQKNLFESMFQSVPDAVVITDTERQIKMVNPSFTRMFGYEPNEVCGQSTAILYADEAEWERQGNLRFNRSMETKVAPYQVKYKHKDGHAFWSETMAAPLRSPDGALLGYLAAGRDITERLQAEEAKHEFISVVSHELRTPLTSISGSLELVRSGVAGSVSDKASTMVEIALRNSKRLVRLINDILDAEKIQSGNMRYNLEELDLNDLLDQSIDEMNGYGDEFGVTLVKTDTVENAMVKADHDRLLQVMANLISNAVKVSPEGLQVEVGLHKNSGRYRIFVRDHGPGISKEAHDKIYDRFTQADSTTTRKIAGTGLGLSITRTLVVQMGGGIDFTTKSGEGTTFYVDLPTGW